MLITHSIYNIMENIMELLLKLTFTIKITINSPKRSFALSYRTKTQYLGRSSFQIKLNFLRNWK